MGDGLDTPTTRHSRSPAGQNLFMVVISESGHTSHLLPTSGTAKIGRSDECELTIKDNSVSRVHASIRVEAGPRLFVEDLGSANGTKVREAWIEVGELVEFSVGETITFGNVLALVQNTSLRFQPRRIWPHGYFEGRVEEECESARARGATLAIFRVRARRAVGNRVIARAVSELLDVIDVVGSYGPTEIELLIRDVDQAGAERIASSLVRDLVESLGEVEIGFSSYPNDSRSPSQLLELAGPGARERTPSKASHRETGGAMNGALTLAERVGKSELSILLIGETGVGKEVMAEHIHKTSPRRDGPLLRLNCAALSENLLESELFGHVRGSFTGADRDKAGLLETASGGTVFLDEIGELPLSMQAKLLRVLEERKVKRVGGLEPISIDVRFVSATNRNLETEVEEGRFRNDLYFRINGVTIVIPPLRQRVDEILPLADHFSGEAAERLNKSKPSLSADTKTLLLGYSWPGNIRELRNSMERAVVLCDDDVVLPSHLPVEKMRATSGSGPAVSSSRAGDHPAPELEDDGGRAKIVSALARSGGNQRLAADELGIHRRTLMRRMDSLGIARPRKKS